MIPTYSDPDPHSLLVDMSFSLLQSRTSTLAAENCRRWKKKHVWKSWRAASGGTSKSLLQSCQNRPRHFDIFRWCLHVPACAWVKFMKSPLFLFLPMVMASDGTARRRWGSRGRARIRQQKVENARILKANQPQVGT